MKRGALTTWRNMRGLPGFMLKEHPIPTQPTVFGVDLASGPDRTTVSFKRADGTMDVFTLEDVTAEDRT